MHRQRRTAHRALEPSRQACSSSNNKESRIWMQDDCELEDGMGGLRFLYYAHSRFFSAAVLFEFSNFRRALTSCTWLINGHNCSLSPLHSYSLRINLPLSSSAERFQTIDGICAFSHVERERDAIFFWRRAPWSRPRRRALSRRLRHVTGETLEPQVRAPEPRTVQHLYGSVSVSLA